MEISAESGESHGDPSLPGGLEHFGIMSSVSRKHEQIDERCSEFINRFFPLVSRSDWNDWKWQISNSFKTVEDLSRVIDLTEDEKEAIAGLKKIHMLPLRITPYYLSRFYNLPCDNPLRRTMIPVLSQLVTTKNEESDPLNEEGTSPVPGIVHRYPDRVLFTVTQFCSSYCRYCTRAHFVGKLHPLTKEQWDNAINYIERHEEVRDVIISGGDPLTMENGKLEYLLSRLRAIKHVEILRIGTKIPAVLPMRITGKLLTMLKKYQPLYISLHFTHPDEITLETAAACNKLADAGFPMGSQTVLLNGVNNDPDVMKKLMQKLLSIRVKPYYIYQCDPVPGSGCFRTKVEDGLNIIEHLRGFTSGYAVPYYVIDAPGGGGKIPILPEYVIKRGKDKWTLRNYKKKIYYYPNEK